MRQITTRSNGVLPNDVKTERCIKEMRAGFRFEPGRLSQKKLSCPEGSEVGDNGQLSADSEKNRSSLKQVKEQETGVTNHPGSETPANHILKAQKIELISAAQQRPKKSCMNTLQNKCTYCTAFNIQNGICLDSPSTDNGYSDTLHCKDCPSRSEEEPLKPNGLNLNKMDDEDSSTCQRVQVYLGKDISSCARTYLTWPLLPKKLSSIEHVRNGASIDEDLSLFKASKHLEPADPNKSQQSEHCISNQEAGSNIINTTNCVEASVDLLNKNNKSHQSKTMSKIRNTFSKDFAASSSKRQASEQIKESSPMLDSFISTIDPFTFDLKETGSNNVGTVFPDTSEALYSRSSSSSPPTVPVLNKSSVNPSQIATLDFDDSCDSSPQLLEAIVVSVCEEKSPPKLEPYFKTSHFICKSASCEKDFLHSTEKCGAFDLLLPPLLSPLNSPLKHISTNASVENESKILSVKGNEDISYVDENGHVQDLSSSKMASLPSHDDVDIRFVSRDEEESQQASVSDARSQSSVSDFSTQSSISPSCSTFEHLVPPDETEEPEVLGELEAYKHDILLVDAFQDDSELFEKLPQKSGLRLGPVRTSEASKSRLKKMVKIMTPACESSQITQSTAPTNLDFLRDSPEDSPQRSWRPQSNSTSSALQSDSTRQCRVLGSYEENALSARKHFPPLNQISQSLASRLGFIPRATSTLIAADNKWQKPGYCRNYFSDSLNCGFKACRFHHVPVYGDEKFCIEAVARFVKNPACLHKAGEVFTSFYQSNKPGGYFSLPVLVSLQWALLKAGMLSDLFSVIRTALAYNIVPHLEFLLDLFNCIREKGLLSFVPEVLQLTFKMADAGLSLNMDCLDCWKMTDLHQTVSPNSAAGNSRLIHAEYLFLAQAVVEMELCTKQEDWKRLGKVFQAICQSTQQVNQVERLSGRITVALLSESKDRLTLPFAAFAETAVHSVGDGQPVQSYFGRIGVSLMLRYHKTYQWAKGLKVVEVLTAAKVRYATLKGLFGNEDGTSRCHLINVATELFLLNKSVEGALNTLRENAWFLTSGVWPCAAADIDNRTHVLLRLAELTSHRDTLEILSNLPGLKEPNDNVDISRYTSFFTGHLQVCLDRQIIPLASDLVDFMLSKELQVDHALLQMLLHKLGKQNLWLRARDIFKNSVNRGYYPELSAPHGMTTLMVPSHLGEIELALTFEMFISVNASVILALPECSASTLSITLRRTLSGESDYLSAGSRLLSAASVPQPKLNVRYVSVNSLQEQVFALEISSAHRWLRNNHLWANATWASST